jgi:hypothetical protein
MKTTNRHSKQMIFAGIIATFALLSCTPQTSNSLVHVSGVEVFDHLGPTLNHPRIHTLYYNNNVSAAGHLVEHLASTLVNAAPQYSSLLDWYAKGHRDGYANLYQPTLGTVATWNGGPPGTPDVGFNLVDAAVMINNAIDAEKIPRPDGTFDEFVFLVLPDNIHIQCISCNGIHSSFVYGEHIVYYGLISTQNLGGNVNNITWRASHEYVEAVTDPIGGTWYGGNPFTDEVADRCESAPSCVENGMVMTAVYVYPKCACFTQSRNPNTTGERCPTNKLNYWCAAQKQCVNGLDACCSNTPEGC